MAAEAVPLLILGGTGRLGLMLRARWPWAMRDGLRPIWQSRVDRPGCLTWDILNAPAPPWAGGMVLCLAGGRAHPNANAALALAALDAAAAQGARHVFLASSAAVYPPGTDLGEDTPTAPVSAYGAAKLAMEHAALDWRARNGGPGLTILRIGNVAGADALLGAATGPGPRRLDPVPGARSGPLRSYIGPVTLSAVLARLVSLAAGRAALPAILNIAAPRPLAMGALLDAAGIGWEIGPPNPAVVPAVTLDTRRLRALVRLPPTASQPQAIVREWQSLGPDA